MAAVEELETSGWRGLWGRYKEVSREVHRGFIAEWTVTIILLLFATPDLNGCCGRTRNEWLARPLGPLQRGFPRGAPRVYRRMDRHHHPAAVRHHQSGAGLRHSQRFHGGHAADRRPCAGR